jgi:hypothetical protein
MATPAARARDATRFSIAVYVFAALLIDLSYAIHIAIGGSFVDARELPSTLFFFSVWAPLMPLVVFAARRFKFVRGRRLRSLEVHFAIALVLSFLTLLAHKLVFCPHGCYIDCVTYYRIEAWLVRWFGLDFFVYGAVLAGIWILDAVESARQKESQAATIESELATAELKLVTAQVNPQFLRELFDWLGTEVGRDPARAETLITLVADYLRVSVHAIGGDADDSELTTARLAIERARQAAAFA